MSQILQNVLMILDMVQGLINKKINNYVFTK